MKSQKLLTGVALGALVAMFLIPKTRKIMTDALCTLTDSLKNAMGKGEEMMNEAGHVASKV